MILRVLILGRATFGDSMVKQNIIEQEHVAEKDIHFQVDKKQK